MPICAALSALVASASSAADPRLFTSGFRTDQWKVEQGLPQNTVQCLLQSHDGYLWVGTRFGLMRYDGGKPVRYDRDQFPAQSSDNCVALAEVENSLWVGTSKGLLRWQDRAWSRLSRTNGLCDDQIWALAASRAGGLWIGTENGVSRWQAGRFSTLRPNSPGLLPGEIMRHNNVSHLCEDSSGTLWIANSGGLQRLRKDGESFERVAAHGLIGQLVADPAAGVWWSDVDRVYRFTAGQITAFPPPVSGDSVALLHFDRQGVLRAATARHGFFQLQAGKWERLPLPAPLEAQSPRCFLDDREGNLWIGTEFGGLFRLQPRRLRTYTTRDGLPGRDVWSICGASDGSLWFATADGVCQFRDGLIRSLPSAKVEPHLQQARVIWADGQNTLWGATGKGIQGLSRWDPAQGCFVRVLDRAPGDESGHLINVESFYEDRTGMVWAGTSQGVLRLEAGGWRALKASPPHVRAMLQDRAGNLWLGTVDRGLYRWQASQPEVFTLQTNLPSESVWVLHEAGDGSVWIGGDSGLTRLRAGHCATLNTKHGLFDNLINHLLEDDQGRFWLSCNRGISRVAKQELDAAADDTTGATHVRSVVYGEADGMEVSETNGEQQPAGWKDAQGHLWFPTINGVVEIDPRVLRDNPVEPSVLIEQVRANGRAVFGDSAEGATETAHLVSRGQSADELRFAPGAARALEIRYTATSLVAPELVHFRYRLEPYDRVWQDDSGNRRVVSYANLSPGRYTFQVIACNNHGLWNKVGATMKFELRPFFHETVWFYALCAAVTALAIWMAHRRRVRTLARLQVLEHQHALDRERARIAHDIHDDLGSRLSQISILGELADRSLASPDAAREQLGKIRATTGEVFQALDEIVWAANPKQDSVAGLVSYLREFAPEFLGAAGLTCRLDFPSPVPVQPLSAEARHHLFLAVKEALNNVVKHAQATEVSLRLRLDNRTLTLVLADNGRGFAAAEPGSSGLGNGLPSLRERITSLGGEFTLDSVPGRGTRIEFKVPV